MNLEFGQWGYCRCNVCRTCCSNVRFCCVPTDGGSSPKRSGRGIVGQPFQSVSSVSRPCWDRRRLSYTVVVSCSSSCRKRIWKRDELLEWSGCENLQALFGNRFLFYVVCLPQRHCRYQFTTISLFSLCSPSPSACCSSYDRSENSKAQKEKKLA